MKRWHVRHITGTPQDLERVLNEIERLAAATIMGVSQCTVILLR